MISCYWNFSQKKKKKFENKNSIIKLLLLNIISNSFWINKLYEKDEIGPFENEFSKGMIEENKLLFCYI